MTMGAPKRAVTELMLSSVGEKAVRAMKSQSRQNTAPPRKQAGSMTSGLAVPNIAFIKWGAAMPTKDTGPAKAVTQAERMLESRNSQIRRARMWTPMFWA